VRARPHEATRHEAEQLWPAVRAERLFETSEQFAAYRDAEPWRVRVTERGEAAVLGMWRSDEDVLAMRGVWCSARHVADFVADARHIARERGLARVLSPLLPLMLLDPYLREGLRICQRVVAIQGHPRGVLHADPPLGVTLQPGREGDLAALVAIDRESFDAFWVYGEAELAEYFAAERLTVAQTGEGQLIGYTLATASGGAATLGRLAVARSARRHGVARALVADVARWADAVGAETISLCTQEENDAARRLYEAAGFAELQDRYGLAIGNADERSGA